ncbi:MAG TPA: hypothetical protein VFS21_13850 [Roseiflexaceae bacterium]|nr:hypothetical protein [Roseiflexaceae bacterium]
MLNQLPWPLILRLGALALIRPLLSITGLMDQLGRPLGPLLVTALISVLWVAIVVLVRAPRPLPTLVFSGVAYGVFAIALSAALSPLLRGELMGPVTNPFAVVAVLITNAVWGLFAGLAALAVQHLAGRQPDPDRA